MITVTDAFIIAKTEDKKLSCTEYSEISNSYLFCNGDPEYYIRVNKKSGDADTICISAEIMGPVFWGEFDENEHKKYCDELLNAIRNPKKIPITKSIIKAS